MIVVALLAMAFMTLLMVRLTSFSLLLGNRLQRVDWHCLVLRRPVWQHVRRHEFPQSERLAQIIG